MRLGLSRKRLAALLGVNESSLAHWETGKHHPSEKSQIIIQELLNSELF
jgi:DNA-binding transcriptional regulator YiaG